MSQQHYDMSWQDTSRAKNKKRSHLFIYVTIFVSRCSSLRCGRWQHEPREEASKGVPCHVCLFLVVRLIESSSQHTHTHTQCLCGDDDNATLSVVWCCWLNLTTSKDKKGRNSDHVQLRRHSARSYIKRNKKKEAKKIHKGVKQNK